MRWHGIFGLYDAGRLWTFAVWYKAKTGQYHEFPSINKHLQANEIEFFCLPNLKYVLFILIEWCQKLLNGMDDTNVCLTMCLDIIGKCNSRLEMLHTRD